jgi:hypothetical protein
LTSSVVPAPITSWDSSRRTDTEYVVSHDGFGLASIGSSSETYGSRVPRTTVVQPRPSNVSRVSAL